MRSTWGVKTAIQPTLFAGERLCCFGRQSLCFVKIAFNNLHFMPVVRKLLAAIQACHVSSRDRSCFREALAWSFSNRKAEVFVAATEQDIKQTRHKNHQPQNCGFLRSVILPTWHIVLQDMA